MDALTLKLAKNYVNRAASLPVTNLIPNGNFTDTTGWGTRNANVFATNNVLSLIATAQKGYTQISLSANLVVGHKYYTRCLINNPASAAYLTNITVMQALPPYKALFSRSIDGTGDFVLFNNISTIVNDEQSYSLRIVENRESGWDAIQIKKLVVMDLTETFGAGNEPAETEMEELLAYFDDSWFDGTSNFGNFQWFMKYLLTRIRTLEIAVAGIGGS